MAAARTTSKKSGSTNGPKKSSPPDVLSLLHRDHEMVGAMLEEVKGCEPGDRRLKELSESIAQALTVHAKIEEDVFYPALRKRAEESEQLTDVFEAYTEHDVIKHLIALVESDRSRDEKFKAELQVLGEAVTHHVKEEESTIFAMARELMSREELVDFGARMAKKKERLMKDVAA